MSATFHTADATRPAGSAIAVTPSDATVIPVTRGLYVGTGGTLAVTMAGSQTVATFTNVANGTLLPIQVTQVRATGTVSATDILALY